MKHTLKLSEAIRTQLVHAQVDLLRIIDSVNSLLGIILKHLMHLEERGDFALLITMIILHLRIVFLLSLSLFMKMQSTSVFLIVV